jgi:hypothetical protein
MEEIRLGDVAHGRSGDKGNHANVAVLAYTQAGYDWLCGFLTTDRVGDYFACLGSTRLLRYEAPKLLALNFILENVLGGGASQSLRTDTQGKALALSLLQMRVPRPEGFEQMRRVTKPGGRS